MKEKERYPKLNLRSKNEIAKRISSKKLPTHEAIELINYCLSNFKFLWRDNLKESNPKKQKWVRDSSRSKLGYLQKLIGQRILKPLDKELPPFIFGGVSEKDTKRATEYILGIHRKRTMLKLDMSRFFEHVKQSDVERVFVKKFGCSPRAARVISELCCVKPGPKHRPTDEEKTLGRGFATSPRLAIWCNLDLFLKIDWLVKKELKGHDPRSVIYVDDIGISSSRIDPKTMANLYQKLKELIEHESSCKLEVNEQKTVIVNYLRETFSPATGEKLAKMSQYEFLGIKLLRNKLLPGSKTRAKEQHLKQIRTTRGLSKHEQASLKGISSFSQYVRRGIVS